MRGAQQWWEEAQTARAELSWTRPRNATADSQSTCHWLLLILALRGPTGLVGPGISPQRCSCFLEDRSNQYSAKTLEGRHRETRVQPHQISRASFRGTSGPGGRQPRIAAGGVEPRESSHTCVSEVGGQPKHLWSGGSWPRDTCCCGTSQQRNLPSLGPAFFSVKLVTGNNIDPACQGGRRRLS